MAEKNYITQEGKQKLEDELEELKVVKRKEIAEKIKEAREQGDLSENAEYDAAKDEQRNIEARITELEEIIKNAVVIEAGADKDIVNVGSVVKVLDVEMDEEVEYHIVGSSEMDIFNNKISYESPFGAALLGKKEGDTVIVTTPIGDEIEYKITELKN